MNDLKRERKVNNVSLLQDKTTVVEKYRKKKKKNAQTDHTDNQANQIRSKLKRSIRATVDGRMYIEQIV